MMTDRWNKPDYAIVAAIMAMAACVFVVGISWGLPSRAADPFLFGEHRAWTGSEILRLAPENQRDPDRGADVDANPVTDRRHAVWLNETDEQRAEIVRRYRLYSYQPDEMITFKSLSKMKPGKLDFDPRLYQYGGLWVYPVGVLLKVASLVRLVDVRSDAAFYLDHPEAFGRFYVVARAYSAAWGVAGVPVVYWLLRRMTGGRVGAAAAAFVYVWLPAVVNSAHEAKPHMAGAVLMLLTVVGATRFVDTGVRRWALAAGVLAGASLGMVLSGLWAFVVLPVMAMLRPMPGRRRLRLVVAAAAIGVLVYVVTNPYVAYNAAFRRARLTSNLTNSTAMYAVGGASNAVANAGKLVAEGASAAVAVVGVIGVVILWLRSRRSEDRAEAPARGPGVILGALAAVVLVQFVLLAAGKPGEYGRFALLPDIALAVAAAAAIGGARAEIGPIMRGVVLAALSLAVVPFGAEYGYAFWRDAQPRTSRLRAAQELATMQGAIGLRDEPAPYLMPPVNLFDRQLILLPRGAVDLTSVPVDFELRAVDGAVAQGTGRTLVPSRFRRSTLWRAATPISWANKRFELVKMRGFVADAGAGVTQTASADSGRR